MDKRIFFMNTADIIQISIMLILLGTMILFLKQLFLQNNLLKAQMLRDRFDMYWQLYNSITEKDFEDLNLIPDDYMDVTSYNEVYKNSPDKSKKYLRLFRRYEYLAFVYSLKNLNLPDPLGYQWTESWAKDLLVHPEFIEVHNYHKSFYPEFARYLDNILNAQQSAAADAQTATRR